MHDLQFGIKLLIVNHVLRGHVELNTRDLVVGLVALFINVGKVPQLVVDHLQELAGVLHVQALHRLPAAPLQESLAAHLADLGRLDVDGRLPAPAARAEVGAPTVGVLVAPGLGAHAVAAGGRDRVGGQGVLPEVGGRQGRGPRGVRARDRQGEVVQLLEAHQQRRREHQPPLLPPALVVARAGRVPVPAPLKRRRQLLLQVQGLLQLVAAAVPDRPLDLRPAQAEAPQQGALPAQLQRHAHHHGRLATSPLVVLQAPVLGAVVAGVAVAGGVVHRRRGSGGVAVGRVAAAARAVGGVEDHQLAVVPHTVDRVRRNGFDGQLVCNENPAI
mmetsp:Transcript_40679/g.117448  ORF Transcript_40679/g.117448 Transcript_40679/m.117448 type:complete len:330 (-) Transcript_40679:1249-2238(-)